MQLRKVFSTRQASVPKFFSASVLAVILISGCSTSIPAPIIISSQTASVRIGQTLVMSATQSGAVLDGGIWRVVGGASNGTVSASGVYTPPPILPSSNLITITYQDLGQTTSSVITVVNPLPVISTVQPSALPELSNTVELVGSGFVGNSTIVQDGTPVPTTFVDSTHLRATVNISSLAVTSIKITVSNPDPGASFSTTVMMPVTIAPVTVSPQGSSVRIGNTLTLSGMQLGQDLTNGSWSVVGGDSNGTITKDGVYIPPAVLPSLNSVSIVYTALGQTATAGITLLNPVPVVNGATPAPLSELTDPIVIAGSGFVNGSQLIAAGKALPTTFVDSNHLAATVVLASRSNTSIKLTVSNPDPGASISGSIDIAASVFPIVVSPQAGSVRVGETAKLSATQNGTPVESGLWAVVGGPANGSIDGNGLYTPPPAVTKSGQAVVSFTALDQTATATLSLLNPTPVITNVEPATFTWFNTNVVVTGTGFLPGSRVYVNGSPIKTTFSDSTHLLSSVTLSTSLVASVALSVLNPDPGSVSSDQTEIPVKIAPISISPTTLSGGNFTATLSLPGMPPNPVVTMDGVPLVTTSVDNATVDISGYLPYWTSGNITISLSPSPSAQPFASIDVPIAATTVSYDVASRFAAQAGFGPRHDIIERIQEIGLGPFVDEQMKVPPDIYLDPTNGRRDYLLHVVSNNTQLRLRTAWAFQSFIPEQGIFQQQSVLPWEMTLEAHAFGNFSQIMLDTASDPNVTTLLNLPGNQAPRQAGVHPNQNFAREFLQLFTIGPVMLNDDGSLKLDASGTPVPSYGEDTILDLSRALTGWTYAPIVNKSFTAYGIDYSQPLVSIESQHDHGSKTIFGSISLPAGQTAEQDRDQVLDGVFNHPNVPPFISRRLIQRLVKSQPSPAYVKRISAVFKDDGNGTRGNLAAVIKGILLDPEARVGDTQPSADDGFVQDPLSAEIYAMILTGIESTDGSASYYPGLLDEPWWFAPSVFAYYSPDYTIPGTSLNSPEFQLLTSTSIVQRSQLLWGMINGPQEGFEPWRTSWLNSTFPTLPRFLDALDHLLYHGTMSDSERDAINAYCATLPDNQSQLRAALFLALTYDESTVVH